MTVGRNMRTFYFMMGGLTIFKNKSKGLVERKIVTRITFGEKWDPSLTV